MPLITGSLIDGRYRVIGRIGHGGMAEVYEAADVINKQTIAIKLIKEDVMSNAINIKRFENEALIAASLNHPNIVRVFNHGVINGVPYIANEYIKGQTLKDVLDFRGPLPMQEAIDYMIQLTDALQFAHQHGIIHRDVKPENIYVMSDGTIKLGDFGIAQAEGYNADLTKTNEIIGSVHYLAPEIARGRGASAKSDIYAAGVTFFEILTGHPPFERNTPVNVAVAHIKDKFPSLRMYLNDYPKEVERIIFTACKKNPFERYNSAEDMKNDLVDVKNHPELLKEKKSIFAKIFGFK